MGLDTACSSSLVALHLARQSLADGETVVALAAGTNLSLVPSTPVHLSQLSALSAAGRSQTFDAGADGYGRGEGVAVVSLEMDALDEGAPTNGSGSVLALVQGMHVGSGTLRVATQFRARIHSRVPTHRLSSPSQFINNTKSCAAGTSYNQDGRSSALTAPNGPAQTALIQKALRSGDARARELGVMSMHGTGTPLGDPIEVGAVAAVFVEGAPRDRASIALTASKSWIGHSEPSAGLSGVTQAALSLTQAALPAILHLREVNQYVCTSTKPVAPGTLFFFGWG